MTARRAGIAALLVGIAHAAPCAADDACPPPGAPWVRLVVQGRAQSDSAKVLGLLRAELASRHIALCEDAQPGATPAIATVDVRVGETAALVNVEVHDAVTAKSVRRDVALDTVPPDGRPLTIALAADELLRASWAELALRTAPPPARPVPVEIRRSVDASLGRPTTPRAALGAAFAVDAFGAGTTLLGADADARLWVVPRLALDARIGLRGAATLHAPDGDVAAQAFAGKLGAALTLTPPTLRAGLDLQAHLALLAVQYSGTALAGATGYSRGDVAVLLDGGLGGWLRLGSDLRLVAEAEAALPLHPVRITDGAAYIGGIADAGLAASLGLWGTF